VSQPKYSLTGGKGGGGEPRVEVEMLTIRAARLGKERGRIVSAAPWRSGKRKKKKRGRGGGTPPTRKSITYSCYGIAKKGRGKDGFQAR